MSLDRFRNGEGVWVRGRAPANEQQDFPVPAERRDRLAVNSVTLVHTGSDPVRNAG